MGYGIILGNGKQAEWYTNWKEVARKCCLSESEWYRLKCQAVMPGSLFGKPKNVYDPFTLSLDVNFYRAAWEKRPADGIYTGGQAGGQIYEAKLIAAYPQAMNIAESACSLSALRVSKQQLQAALGGGASQEDDEKADDYAQ